MDFALTEEQQEIQALSEKILTDKVTPEALQRYDNWEVPRFDTDLWQALSDSGLLGLGMAADKGGMGFSFHELSVLYEACGQVLAPVPVIVSTVSGLALQAFEQGNELLPAIASGSCIVTIAIDQAVNTMAEPSMPVCEDGKLSGTLKFVPYFEQADQMLVVAQDGGPSLFLVDAKDPSIEATALLASSYEPQHDVQLSATPAKRIGGEEAVRFLTDHYTVAVCALQVGIADRMVKLTAEYTAEREQFGVKIATFQGVAHRAANCFIDLTCLRLVTQHAASRLAEGLEAAEQICTAKAWCGDAGHRISYSAQHLHGGMGVDRSYPLWRYALWAKQNELVLGNTGDHLRSLGDLIAGGAFDIDL